MSQKALNDALEIVKKEYSNVKDGEDLIQRVSTRFRSVYDKPPIDEISMVLGKNIALEEARIILFCPEQIQMRYYVAFLSILPNDNKDSNHPLIKLQPIIVTLTYLIHRKKWLFLEEFILHGGLLSFADSLIMDNLYMRGQILEIFLTITDVDSYDWFKKNDDVLSKSLHRRMLELHEHPSFLSNLLSNRLKSYPGGSFRCLQLLAFWLSWVRALYTNDQILQLSQSVLDHLEAWSKGEIGGKEDLSEGMKEMLEQEQKLGAALFEDFSKAGAADSNVEYISNLNKPEYNDNDNVNDIKTNTDSRTEEGLIEVSADGSFDLTKSQTSNSNSNTTIEGPQMNNLKLVLGTKEDGNVQYRHGNFKTALKKYEIALDIAETLALDGGGKDGEVKCWEAVCSLHFNRANTLWKMWESKEKDRTGQDIDNDVDTEVSTNTNNDQNINLELVHKSESAIRACISVSIEQKVGEHLKMKSAYRLASIYLIQKEYQKAIECVDECMKTSTNTSSDGASSNDGDMDALKQLRRKCVAKMFVTNSSSSNNTNDNDNANQKESIPSVLDHRMSNLLQQLQLRRAREDVRETHPWRGWTPPKEEDTLETSTSITNDIDIKGSSNTNITNDITTGMFEKGKGVEDIGQLVNRLNKESKTSKISKSSKGKDQKKSNNKSKDKKDKKTSNIVKLAAATGLSMVDILEKKSEIL